jgi:hypothetical protein
MTTMARCASGERIGPVPKEGRHPYNRKHANALLMQIDAATRW